MELERVQEDMHRNPHDNECVDREKAASELFHVGKKNQLFLLRDKSKIAWLKEGDANSKVFLPSYQG